MGSGMIGLDTTHEDVLTECYDEVSFYVDVLHACVFESDNEQVKLNVSDKDLIRSLSGLKQAVHKFETTFGLHSDER